MPRYIVDHEIMDQATPWVVQSHPCLKDALIYINV